MRLAKLNDIEINALETKSKYGEYKSDVYNQFRKASQEGALKCVDCEAELVFRGGKQYQPHFAHKQVVPHCQANAIDVSEEHLSGQSILYFWLMDEGLGSVYVDHYYGHRRATASVELLSGPLVFHYVRKERKMADWMDKIKTLSELKIDQYVIFSHKDISKMDNNDTLQFRKWTAKLLGHIILSLDTETQELHVMKYMELYDEKDELYKNIEYSQKYRLLDIHIVEKKLVFPGFEESAYLTYVLENEKMQQEIKEKRIQEEKSVAQAAERVKNLPGGADAHSDLEKVVSRMSPAHLEYFGANFSLKQKLEIAGHILNNRNYVTMSMLKGKTVDAKVRRQIEMGLPLTEKQMESLF